MWGRGAEGGSVVDAEVEAVGLHALGEAGLWREVHVREDEPHPKDKAVDEGIFIVLLLMLFGHKT